jgi:hypothetical protein
MSSRSSTEKKDIPEDPIFSIPGQSSRLEKKLFQNEIEPIKALCGKSFFSSRALCPEVLNTGSSGKGYLAVNKDYETFKNFMERSCKR